MLAKLAEYSLVVILLAVMVEELGIPMPIPTDVLIVFIGAVAATSVLQLGQVFIMLSVVSAIGASGLYAIVRHSGRPLVERFGRYVHLGPKQLARSEALLARGGWKAIALGRATPGLRYPTVIACGLFRISYPRFISAHLVGSAVYIAVFLVLGRIFGPAVLSWTKYPTQYQKHGNVDRGADKMCANKARIRDSKQTTGDNRGVTQARCGATEGDSLPAAAGQ